MRLLLRDATAPPQLESRPREDTVLPARGAVAGHRRANAHGTADEREGYLPDPHGIGRRGGRLAQRLAARRHLAEIVGVDKGVPVPRLVHAHASALVPPRAPTGALTPFIRPTVDQSLILQAAPNVAELSEPSVSARLSADETAPSEGANSAVSLQASSSFAAPSPSFFQLAPQIVTLCGGSFSPFDFGLTKIQHEQLFVAGQISVHMTAAQHAAAHLEKDLPITPDDNQDLLGSVVAALSRAKDAAASVAASAAGGEDSASEANAKLPSHEGTATPEMEAVAPVLSRQTKLAFLLYLLHMEYRK
eukprot:scaffold151560_cov28-Tisochrysis_lutea.AAC.1